MAKVKQFKITFKNIKDGELTCEQPIVKLFNYSENIIQKCEFDTKDNSVNISIYEDALEGLAGTCIQFSVLCETCGKCPQKDGKICFCNNYTDCEECQDCISGLCVNRCPDLLCIDDKCVNCGDNDDCPNNQICVGGKCDCPPNQPYFDEVAQKCYGCQNDGECGPCYRCIDGNCVRLNCICDEDLDKCVECNAASECPLPNQCCVNNKCVCCPGYIWDHVLGECVIEPECTSDEDCDDPCKMCVNGECVDIPCPTEGEICIDGDCVPIPCEGPCDDATDCGPNCGCLDGQCVDCESLDCVTCAQTIGCKCVNGDCEKDDSPCAQYSCDTNCGDRPDCECNEETGQCEEKECEGESTLEKNEAECKLEYNLETSECCECSKITLDNKIMSIQISNALNKFLMISKVEVRKGEVSTPLGILDIHRVDEDQYDDIMDNEEATQGQVQVVATYTYEGLSGGNPTGVLTTENVTLTPIFDIAGVGYSQQTIQFNIPGRQYPTNLRVLRSVTLTYTLISELTFESGCIYDEGTVIGSYTFNDTQTEVSLTNQINLDTPGQDSNASYWIAKTVNSEACRNPEAKWYKAVADSSGNITNFETTPFRKSYLTKLTPTTYTDFIDEPDENPGPADNNGELFSGYYYKVTTDCACTNEATAYYESTCANPGRLVFCDPLEASVEFDPCGKKFTFTSEFVTDCLPNYDYYGDNADFVPDAAKLRYSIHVNGSDTALPGSTVIANDSGLIYSVGQEFTSSELIQFIEIRFSHDNCEECTIRIDSDVERDLPSYVIVCEPSGISNTTYTITFTFPVDVTQIVVGSNTATPGSPTINVTLANTVTELEMEVTYDGCSETVIEDLNLPENCCDDLVVNLTQDSDNCSDESYSFVALANPAISGDYTFSVDNVFAETNSTGLFSTLKNVGLPNEPTSVKVVFTPTSTSCEAVDKSINIDKSFSFGLNFAGGSPVTVCSSGATSTNITYTVPNGVTGDVTYEITGAGQSTVAVNGPTPLVIAVAGTPTQTKVLSIVSNTLLDSTGNGCAIFTPDPISIQFITQPEVTGISILPLEPCEEAPVTVTLSGTAGAIATVNGINFLGAVPSQMTVGTPYTLYAGTVGNMTLNVTNVSAGTCSVPTAVSNTVVVKDTPEITSIETVCETPGSPSSNIEITVLGSASSTVAVNPLTDNIILIESPAGTYTGVLDDTFNGVAISVQITKLGCSDSETHNIEACACDPAAEVIIKLGGVEINSDSGCVGETSNYTTTIAGLNGGETYAWRLDSPTNPTVLGTASSYLYTFDANLHTLYVTVTDDEGCEVTDSITVDGNPLPTVVINQPEETCLSQANLFTTTVVGSSPTYQWQLDNVNIGGATNPTYSYTPADTDPHDLSVIVTTSDGCQVEEIVEVIAVDCCVECAIQTVDVPDQRVQSFTDEDGNTFSVPGVHFFECADPSAQNDSTAAALQTFLRTVDPCGATVVVTWADSLTTPNCVTLTITNSTLVFDFITMGLGGEYTFDVTGC